MGKTAQKFDEWYQHMKPSKGFTIAEDALDALASSFDEYPNKASARVRIDFDSIATLKDQKRLLRELDTAAKAGAAEVRVDRHTKKPVAVFCKTPTALFTFLKRQRAPEVAEQLIQQLCADIDVPAALKSAVVEVRNAWARGKSWERLEAHIDSLPILQQVFQLSRCLLEHDDSDMDYRSFSMIAGCGSKALEHQRSRVAKILIASGQLEEALDAESTLAQKGLEKIPQPIIVGGPIRMESADVSSLPYVGLPGAWISSLRLYRVPTYVLLVENFVSFHRHCVECNLVGDGVIIFTAGFPTRACQRAITSVLGLVPAETPVFHWGDVDYGGVRILDFLYGLCDQVGFQVRPHLMSPELAEEYGAEGDLRGGSLSTVASPPANILGRYLGSRYCKVLEQEQLAPSSPIEAS